MASGAPLSAMPVWPLLSLGQPTALSSTSLSLLELHVKGGSIMRPPGDRMEVWEYAVGRVIALVTGQVEVASISRPEI